ncbi:MAG TPA: hypothetical protein VLT33_12375 [Labilithrix sp.]|nr:hypothetical protein [Labilithrix sp.]
MRRLSRALPVALAIAGVALPTAARAEEAACADIGLSLAKPAFAEWTTWLGAGAIVTKVGTRDHDTAFAMRAGGAVDFSVARFGSERQYGGQHELRAGPWLNAETTFFGATALEGGGSFDLGHTYHARWGTGGLRLGWGALHLDDRWRPGGSATLTWGVRSVPARYVDGGACVEGDRLTHVDQGRPRRALALASGARAFATARADTDGNATLTFGIEIEPTFLLPPYSLARLAGTRP